MIDDSDSVFDKRSLVDIVEGVTDPEIPDPLSPEWHDFVMSKFADNELIEINTIKNILTVMDCEELLDF